MTLLTDSQDLKITVLFRNTSCWFYFCYLNFCCVFTVFGSVSRTGTNPCFNDCEGNKVGVKIKPDTRSNDILVVVVVLCVFISILYTPISPQYPGNQLVDTV